MIWWQLNKNDRKSFFFLFWNKNLFKLSVLLFCSPLISTNTNTLWKKTKIFSSPVSVSTNEKSLSKIQFTILFRIILCQRSEHFFRNFSVCSAEVLIVDENIYKIEVKTERIFFTVCRNGIKVMYSNYWRIFSLTLENIPDKGQKQH